MLLLAVQRHGQLYTWREKVSSSHISLKADRIIPKVPVLLIIVAFFGGEWVTLKSTAPV
jgi:hypothetical protein